jgi:hypothetical protein
MLMRAKLAQLLRSSHSQSGYSIAGETYGEASLNFIKSGILGLTLAGFFASSAAVAGALPPVSDQFTVYDGAGAINYQFTLYEDGSQGVSSGGLSTSCVEGIKAACFIPYFGMNPTLAYNGTNPTAFVILEHGTQIVSDIFTTWYFPCPIAICGSAIPIGQALFASDMEGDQLLYDPLDPYFTHYTGGVTLLDEPADGIVNVTSFLSPFYSRQGYTASFYSEVETPEPLTLSLFGAGLAGAVAMRRRKKAA